MALSDYLSPHFRLSEFASHDGAPFTPSAIENLRKQAQLLEVIRAASGNRPIRITSGYRSPAHNVRVGGATHSQHPLGTATDMNIEGMSPRQTTDLITGLIAQGQLPSGGLGVYNGWVHYDHRPGNARWAEDGGPVPSYAKRATTADEVIGAASPAFEDTAAAAVAMSPDLPAPMQAATTPLAPDFDPKTREIGSEATRAIMSDLLANAKSFNYADQVAKRDEFSRQILDAYGKDQEMSASDIPGAIIGAPFNLLRGVMAPVRRALGDPRQLQADALGGDTGAALLAAATGDPSVLARAQKTPSASEWLKGLVTDQEQRKAAAARQALAALGLYDKRMGKQADMFLTEAQTAAQKAAALSSASEAYSRLSGPYYEMYRTQAATKAADANAAQSIASANKTDVDRALAPGMAAAANAENLASAGNYDAQAALAREKTGRVVPESDATIAKDMAAARASDAAAGLTVTKADEIEERRPFVLGKLTQEISKIGADKARILADTDNMIKEGDKIGEQISLLKSKNLLTQEQIEVLDKTGGLMEAREAKAWIDMQAAAQRQVEDAQMSGLREQELAARIADIKTRTESASALMAARAQKLPGELGVLQGQLDLLNARAKAVGNRVVLGTGNPVLGEEFRRAVISNLTTRTAAIQQGMNGMSPKDEAAARDRAIKTGIEQDQQRAAIQKSIVDGVIPRDPAGEAIAQKRLDMIGLGNDWEARYTDNFGPWNSLDIVPRQQPTPIPTPTPSAAETPAPTPTPTPTAVPTGNVGGAQDQAGSTLTTEQATHRNAGGFDPNYYNSLADLQMYYQRGLVPRDVAKAIAIKRGWAMPSTPQ
jgi:hypothetical protein